MGRIGRMKRKAGAAAERVSGRGGWGRMGRMKEEGKRKRGQREERGRGEEG